MTNLDVLLKIGSMLGLPGAVDDPAQILPAIEALLEQNKLAKSLLHSDLPMTHQHNTRQTFYRELARGTLQSAKPLEDGARVVAYVGEDMRLWFRPPSEFDDRKRFSKL